MKSVFGMILVFIGVYIVIYFDIFGFFAQKWVFIFSISSVVVMLIIALFLLGSPLKRKRGGQDDENIHLS